MPKFVNLAEVSYQYYQPGKDRQRPHLIELLLTVPAGATAVVTMEINRGFLKWTEHPPDAHHGFYIKYYLIFLYSIDLLYSDIKYCLFKIDICILLTVDIQ